ncbi:hypothetical protein BDW67DRAFT_158247 [Aspergillus spinulosporus]
MPSYRLEQASTGRAGCQNKECKEQKIKIAKGELRLGSWVDTERFQSWFWRHWGCVTPKVIANINDIVGEGDERDLETLDGYEDLPAELQEKVARALEQGHVDDEDWRGDPEMNVRGSSGFRVRASAKAKKAKDADEEEKDDAAEEKKTPAKKTKKAKKAEHADDEENDDATKEKKSPSSKTKKRTRVQVDDDNHDAETASPKRPRRAPTGIPKQVPTVSSGSDDSANESPEPKHRAAKRSRQAKEAKPAPKHGKKKAFEDSEVEPAAEKPKRGRKKAAA